MTDFFALFDKRIDAKKCISMHLSLSGIYRDNKKEKTLNKDSGRIELLEMKTKDIFNNCTFS